jgi:PAS domain S-box-containing protein
LLPPAPDLKIDINQEKSILQAMQSGYALHEVITDKQGQVIDYRFLDINPAFEQMTGLDRERLIGNTVLSILPETEEVWIKRCGRVAQSGQPDTFESYSAEFDKHFQVSVIAPQIGKFAVIIQDLGEHKKAQHALAEQSQRARQAEAELAAIYDNAPIVMLIINAERKIVKLNHAALKLTGLTKQQAVGQYCGDLFHCLNAKQVCGQGQDCQSCLVNLGILQTLNLQKVNQAQPATLTVATAQGPTRKHLSLSSAPVSHAGENMALVCIDDITDLVETSSQQRECEHREQQLFRQLNVLLDAIDDPLCLLNKNFELLWTNQAYRQLQESSACDENGLVFRPLFADSSYYPAQRCLNNGARSEADIRTADGRFWQVRAFPLSEAGLEIEQIIVVALDISEKERLQEEAIRTSRLASLGMLATGVAHEINNPNAFILYNSDILQGVFKDLLPYLKSRMQPSDDVEFNGLSWGDLENELPEMLAAMQEGARRIKRIVDDLRDYARHEGDNTFTSLDLNDVVQKAVRLVHNSLKKSTDNFSLELTENLPPVLGDFGRLEQVVINLLLNSCQALTDHTQAIRMKTFFSPHSDQVVLQVIDQGRGIPAEILASITEPFTTSKRDKGGTGLGLSVSNRIVKAHAGSLKFESEPGQGTTVSLILPISPSKD